TVKASSNTGLSAPDVFYFGNAVGESGNVPGDYSVSLSDELLARNNPVSIVPGTLVTNRFDFNRDGTVSVIDQLLSRNNITTAISKLKQITVPALLLDSGLRTQGLDDSADDLARGVALRSLSSGTNSPRAPADESAPAGADIRLPAEVLDVSSSGQSETLARGRRSVPKEDAIENDLLELLAVGRR